MKILFKGIFLSLHSFLPVCFLLICFVVMSVLMPSNSLASDKPWLGAQVQPLAGAAKRFLSRITSTDEGVLVASVAKGGPGEQMGIKQNDIILGFNYHKIKNISEFERDVSGSSPGDRIVLSVFRMSPTILTLVGRMGQSPESGGQEQVSAPLNESPKQTDADMTAKIFTPAGHHEIESLDYSRNGKLIISGGRTSLKLWDAATGKEIRTFTGITDAIYSVAFSPDASLVLTGCANHKAKLWDVETGKAIKEFTGLTKDDLIDSVAFSPDGRTALTGGSDKTIRLWDVATGREIRAFTGHTAWVNSVGFSPDGKYALSGSWDGAIKLWDISTGAEIRTFKEIKTASEYKAVRVNMRSADRRGRGGALPAAVAAPSKADVPPAPAVRDSTIKPSGGGTDIPPALIVRQAEKMAWNIESMKNRISTVIFSPDGKYLLSGAWDSTIRMWDVSTGQKIKTFAGHTGRINSLAFSSDGARVLSAARDNLVKLWDVATGRELRTFTGHTGEVSSIAFSNKPNVVISGGFDGTIRFWNGNSGEEFIKFVGLNDGEWIIITQEGYYNSSLNGHKYLNILVNKKVYGIDQFYDLFYRPDIVTSKLRDENIKDLITLTLSDAIKTPPPRVNFGILPKETNAPVAKICYRVKSTGGGIGEIRIFQNGKLIKSDGFYREVVKNETTAKMKLASMNSRAVYQDMRSVAVKGQKLPGAQLDKPKGDLVEECVEVETIAGENEISLTAFNAPNTVQSFLETAKFTSTVRQDEPHLYILSVGIDKYRDASINLKYAAKDAKDFSARLSEKARTLYKPENIHLVGLANEQAGKQNILATIDSLSKKIKHGDCFIFFDASHGLLLQGQYYIVTSGFDGKLYSTTSLISSNEIVEISKKIKSLSQLFVFDTCHAGGVDTIVSGLYDARMSVLAKKMGLHIFASAGSVQTAMDGYKGNGLYTYTLLQGIANGSEVDSENDGTVTVTKLGRYSKDKTTEISTKLGHPQTPFIINFGKDSTLFTVR
ncbi:MAG: caspase family protein [Syntrophales bacterium]|nr:caspase family protein [Syntrophales bacterium]